MIKRVCAHYQMITLSSTRPYHKSQTICLFISYGKLFHPLQLIIYFKNNILYYNASLHISDEPNKKGWQGY